MRRVDVVIVEYDPTWPLQFESERLRLMAAAQGMLVQIEHFGSTSVPELAAKPVIDIMASTSEQYAEARLAAAVGPLGYDLSSGEFVDKTIFRKSIRGRRTHHLHVVDHSTLSVRNEILFRDRLRKDGALAAEYADLKLKLASADLGDRFAYSRGKTAFVQGVIDEERTKLGLPLVDVYSGAGPARQEARVRAESQREDSQTGDR